MKEQNKTDEKVQFLVQEILRTDTDFFKIYGTVDDGCFGCPFCGVFKRGTIFKPSIKMDDLEHNNNCIYYLATELKKDIS